MQNHPIIDTFKSYSHEAEEVLYCLQKYDYRHEATKWEDTDQPLPMELDHPTIQNLYHRLARHFIASLDREDNFDRSAQRTKANIEIFSNNLEVDGDVLTAATFTLIPIPIESMLDVANEFKALNLISEYRHLLNIYNFAYGIRQWYSKSKRNPGTPIQINLELNYDEATPDEKAADAPFKTFSDLFKPSCNYTTKQRRTLYDSLKALYAKNTIQYHIEHIYLAGLAAQTTLRYRDTLTESYNISPNFFIRTRVKKEDIDFDHPTVRMTYWDRSKGQQYPPSNKHFKDRIFDRDTLILREFSINPLFVIAAYAGYEDSWWHSEIHDTIRHDFIESIDAEYQFYIIHPEDYNIITFWQFNNAVTGKKFDFTLPPPRPS